jgi:ribosomal protein S18 acetylase RimI-like enzyme
MSLTIVAATNPAEMAEARALFLEYAAESRIDLCFQNFEAELAGLPGKYAPPSGLLLLARSDSGCAGCAAIRKLEDGICEMKRLFVRPAFRRHGAGKMLALELIDHSRRLGYSKMRLDTLSSMRPALDLYQALGFYRIPPYYANPLPEVIYLELAF